ncbi:MAG: CoA-binding protein, partial [Chloroflexota bacterium]|nr:CoA-binding protein [Chloroflexota bacterium]
MSVRRASAEGETVHDVFRTTRASLRSLFEPRSVAVIGATERFGSVGRTIIENLINNPLGRPVYAVNPRRNSVLGVPSLPSILDVPEHIDLAVIVTPAATVPEAVRQCARAGVNASIVISAGFREAGPEGARLEAEIEETLRRSPMRLLGPNCLGVMRPRLGLNATFAADMALQGSVAFVSQSGALCTAILDWSLRERVGFSAFVSTGSMLDVG